MIYNCDKGDGCIGGGWGNLAAAVEMEKILCEHSSIPELMGDGMKSI